MTSHMTRSGGRPAPVAGVFCIVSETTGRVIGERRLRTLRKLGANMSAAGTMDAICRAAAETLSSENPADLPYALFYAFDGESQLDLVCSYGVAPDGKADSDRSSIRGAAGRTLRAGLQDRPGRGSACGAVVDARFSPLPRRSEC
ncbi:MAG: hypothetical protein MPW15_12265 [Candidatus Manganitrophus sp.]|nr:hypothetical protein [Candidatus Manganitrophus sp.]